MSGVLEEGDLLLPRIKYPQNFWRLAHHEVLAATLKVFFATYYLIPYSFYLLVISLALEVAGILAEKDGGEVVAFTVGGEDIEFDIERFVNDNKERTASLDKQIRTKVVDADSVVNAILKEALDYDLIVLGCSSELRWYKLTGRSVPNKIAKVCSKPIVMVKASSGVGSWIRKWI